MPRSFLMMLVAAVTLILASTKQVVAAPDELERRPYSVDDMLRTEGIGDVRFAPDSGSIIFEYAPPYEERAQYGVDIGGKILTVKLSEGNNPKSLFQHDPETRYWLGERSPNGKRVLVYQATRTQFAAFVYDFSDETLTQLPHRPQMNERFELNSPIWINDREVIYSSSSTDWDEYGIRARPYSADRVAELRNLAFDGEVSSTSITTHPAYHWYEGSLLSFDVVSKASTILAEGRFGSFALSEDRERLAALRLGQRSINPSVDILTDFVRYDTQLYVFDLEEATHKAFLDEGHVAVDTLRWSTDGSKLAFFSWDDAKPQTDGDHHILHTDDASTVPLGSPNFRIGGASFAGTGVQWRPIAAEWLGDELVVFGSQIGATDDGKSRWYSVDSKTGDLREVVPGANTSGSVNKLQDGSVLIRSENGHFVVNESANVDAIGFADAHLYRVLSLSNEANDEIAFVKNTNEGSHLVFYSVSANEAVFVSLDVDEKILAYNAGTGDFITRLDSIDGGLLYLRNKVGGRAPVFKFNAHLAFVEHPRWTTISYMSPSGAETYSCVLLPFGYDPHLSYPTIVDVYPGTGQSCQNGDRLRQRPLGGSVPISRNVSLLSAQGYLVVTPSNSYAENSKDGVLFEGLTDQVDAALDALIAAGMTDADRIGVWGFSNGSMASLWLATDSDRYKAIVSMFGAVSPYLEYFQGASSFTFELGLGRPIINLVQFEAQQGLLPRSMGASAITDPEVYLRSSPLDRAEQICAPVMLVHSDFDSFSMFHYEAIFTALYRLNKEAELVRYFGEGHGIRSPKNIRDFYDRVFNFFEKNLASEVDDIDC